MSFRLALLSLVAGCSASPRVGELQEALLDEKWWMDPLFQGSTKYHYADGHDWYDSDIGGGYVTGSYVRLAVDSNYVGDWNTGPVYCQGGGTSTFWSPVFQTTVNGANTIWVFNHLSQSYLGQNGRTKGWYNGGALIGLTGGGTCNTGYPTYSSGPHFCNEVRDFDPFTYWKTVGNYTSNCMGSNGTSGIANPVCGGMVNDPCASAANGNGLYCGGGLTGGDPKLLYDCQNLRTAGTTACACGCAMMPKGVNDACNVGCGGDPCASAKYGNGGYCGGGLTGGDVNLLYNCQNGATAGTTICKCGCAVMPNGVNDVCALTCASGDLGVSPPPPAVIADLAGSPSDGEGDGGDGGAGGNSLRGGCSVAATAKASGALWMTFLLLVLGRSKRVKRPHVS